MILGLQARAGAVAKLFRVLAKPQGSHHGTLTGGEASPTG